ncbi:MULTISPECIES: hypothetical protein [Pseudonocardia]|jgi:hypothetical protein|uniref:ABC-2 family transporter n=1 Tax=Pseudonocardia alni TaxID=33907 RepID=A0AA44UQY9_PSEA5|nr:MULTISPECIES: hypothetical protein [Pseudonocardia]MYW76236.1 hypothetical protein [Pseudonocardia sp. SID8383]OJG06454.1 hypothetical protein BG618_02207 [Pseudonocardia autotrophica]PKB31903.1 hypothetical protein ATL51_3606 [Pseudonocardia alni]
MTWVVWRTHRGALLVTAGLGVALCLALVVLAAVDALDTVARDPFGVIENPVSDVAGYLVLAAPALVGAFLGAPLLAGDLERGTHVLLLTQSVSRRRWAGSALLVGGGVAVTTVVTAAAVYAGLAATEPWHDARTVAATGLVPLARTLSALTIGVLTGLLLRRVLAASVLTLATVVVTEVAITALRGHMVAPRLRTGPLPLGGSSGAGEQRLDSGYTLTGGGLRSGASGTGCTQDDVACLRAAGIDGNYVLVHPATDRWPLHWAEVALHLVLAAGAAAWLFARLRRPLGR